jgi:hypothetical protein
MRPFAPDVTESDARQIAADAGLEVRRRVSSTPNGYILQDPDGPSYELLDVAAELIADNAVLAAEPQLLRRRTSLRPTTRCTACRLTFPW